MNRSNKSIARDSSLASSRASGKKRVIAARQISAVWRKNLSFASLLKNPSLARQFMKDTAGPSSGIRGRTASLCSQEGQAVSFMNFLAGEGFFSSATHFNGKRLVTLSIKLVMRFP